MENPYITEQPILNNKFILVTEDNEYRMSHWVREFGLLDASNKQPILDIMRSFNLDSFEEKGTILKVRFRVYPNGANTFETEIDPTNSCFLYNDKWISLKDFYNTFKEAAA